MVGANIEFGDAEVPTTVNSVSVILPLNSAAVRSTGQVRINELLSGSSDTRIVILTEDHSKIIFTQTHIRP